MEESTVAEKTKPYVGALKQLARSGQNKALGLEQAPLIDLPVVIGEAGANAAPERRADLFVSILGDVIATRLTGSEQHKAEALFGFGEYAGKDMQPRYDIVAKLHYGPRGKWDRFRKEPLDDLLMTVLTALHREGVARETARDSAAGVLGSGRESAARRSHTVGGAYSLDSYAVTYNFPQSSGEPRTMLETRGVRAMQDGLESWQMGSQYWGKSPDQAPAITLFGPGALELVHDKKLSQAPYPGRAYVVRVTFPHPLVKNEATRFSLLKQQAVEFGDLVRPGHRDQRDVTPIVPIDHAEIAVRFPADHHPKSVWHFEDLPDYLGPGAPEESNILVPDNSGYVTFEWNDLLIGHSYGIAWRW